MYLAPFKFLCRVNTGSKEPDDRALINQGNTVPQKIPVCVILPTKCVIIHKILKMALFPDDTINT